jgi:hypothetical protein
MSACPQLRLLNPLGRQRTTGPPACVVLDELTLIDEQQFLFDLPSVTPWSVGQPWLPSRLPNQLGRHVRGDRAGMGLGDMPGEPRDDDCFAAVLTLRIAT